MNGAEVPELNFASNQHGEELSIDKIEGLEHQTFGPLFTLSKDDLLLFVSCLEQPWNIFGAVLSVRVHYDHCRGAVLRLQKGQPEGYRSLMATVTAQFENAHTIYSVEDNMSYGSFVQRLLRT